jgi:hypothetical protein
MEKLTDIPFFEEALYSSKICRVCHTTSFTNDFCSERCCMEFCYKDFDYHYDDHNYDYDDDNSSCASDETMLSIYTYVSYGKKHRTKQLKNRIKVKTVEKYGYNYNE